MVTGRMDSAAQKLECKGASRTDLLEAEELDDGEGDRGVEAEAALVWADGAVELHTVAAVHLQSTLHTLESYPTQPPGLSSV